VVGCVVKAEPIEKSGKNESMFVEVQGYQVRSGRSDTNVHNSEEKCRIVTDTYVTTCT
jgi:hypothetical protein